MKIRTLAAGSIIVAGSSLILSWACGPSTPTAATPPAKAVSNLQISGPASIAPGATAQFSAIATFPDGSMSDVSRVALWGSSNRQILTISPSGAATGIQTGETSVQALYTNRGSAFFNVRVLPDGTYRLVGTLSESGLPVADATVAVTDGVGTGLSSTSDIGGGYKLYGVSGAIEITVSKPGYASQSRRLLVTGDAVADFPLTTVLPELNVAGAYLLTFDVAPHCAAVLPAALRERRYTAIITQASAQPSLTVTLGGADFASNGGTGNTFSGRVEPDKLTFFLRGIDDYYYQPLALPFDVVEAIDHGEFLVIDGTIVTTRAGSNLVGTLNGDMLVVGDLSGSARSIVSACIGTHNVTFAADSSASAVRKRR